jgi:hypothetical protein
MNTYVVYFLLGNSPAWEVYMPSFRSTLFHLYRQVGVEWLHLPAYEDGTDSVPKRRHIKFWRRGITRKKIYSVQNTAKVWNQEEPNGPTGRNEIALISYTLSLIQRFAHNKILWCYISEVLCFIWFNACFPPLEMTPTQNTKTCCWIITLCLMSLNTFTANSQPASIYGLGRLLISEKQHYCDEEFHDNSHCQDFTGVRVKCGFS